MGDVHGLSSNSIWALLATGLLASACGKGTPDKVYANYLTGRVNVAGTVSVQSGAPILIEYSTDGFATVSGTLRLNNDQGLLTLPYRIEFKSYDGDYVQLRAYQDSNKNGIWDPGEASGRYDNTTAGNSVLLSIHRVVDYKCATGSYDPAAGTCSGSGTNVGSATDNYIFGANIALDSTTGL